MRCFYLAVETLRHFVPEENAAGSGLKGQVLRLWGELHGLVSLHNSGILSEVVRHPGPFMEQAVADAIAVFQPAADKKPVKR